MMPRPRRSTLFPYTTLFRSDAEVEQLDHRRAVFTRVADHDVFRFQVAVHDAHRMGSVEHAHYGRENFKDRKSTRLNSSHSQISYAVFCLKKKTKGRQPSPAR